MPDAELLAIAAENVRLREWLRKIQGTATPELKRAWRDDATFTSERVGAPGSEVRKRATALLALLDAIEGA